MRFSYNFCLVLDQRWHWAAVFIRRFSHDDNPRGTKSSATRLHIQRDDFHHIWQCATFGTNRFCIAMLGRTSEYSTNNTETRNFAYTWNDRAKTHILWDWSFWCGSKMFDRIEYACKNFHDEWNNRRCRISWPTLCWNWHWRGIYVSWTEFWWDFERWFFLIYCFIKSHPWIFPFSKARWSRWSQRYRFYFEYFGNYGTIQRQNSIRSL